MKTLLRWGVVASAVASASVTPAAGKAEFTGEEVTITLEPERARVAGVYRFHNPGEETQTLKLRYPFARGPEFGDPENVVVVDAAGTPLPYRWRRGEIEFDLAVPPRGEAYVSVSYEQDCYADKFTYILTSKREWRRPFDEAAYFVEAPYQLAPVEGSYKLEEAASREGLVRYELRRDNFYPDVDLTLRWQRPDFYFGSTALESGATPPPPAKAEGAP
ncbi:MAG: hypothetical protein GTN49_06170 [candidate division Zixibacteria bacterium]|nr:hypothetical protein [candidate division Zixibacteria bacterium]